MGTTEMVGPLKNHCVLGPTSVHKKVKSDPEKVFAGST